MVCSSANLSEPVESTSLARDLSAVHLRGRAGKTAGGQAPDLPFNQAGLLRDAPAARGANASSHWESRGRGESAISGLDAGSRPGSGAGAGPRWLQAEKGQSHGSSPRRSGWLGWTPATPLPIIPAAPSKNRQASAWPGSTGVSLSVSVAGAQPPVFFPAWQVVSLPHTAESSNAHPWGCMGAGATPVAFKSCPFG